MRCPLDVLTGDVDSHRERPRVDHRPKTEETTPVRTLAALSDTTRLEMIRRRADGLEHDSLELADDLPRSTVTHHTHILRKAGGDIDPR